MIVSFLSKSRKLILEKSLPKVKQKDTSEKIREYQIHEFVVVLAQSRAFYPKMR